MSNKSKAIYSTKWIAYTAMLTALVIATGFIPPVPTPAGRIYWVDGIVLIAAFLMDPLSAFISGGVGTFLYDFIVGSDMMIPTFFIHGLQGAVVSALLRYVFPKNKLEVVWAGISSLAGAVIVISGYFLYREATRGIAVAYASIPRNIIQEIIGISIALLLCYATTFKKQLKKSGLLPDFNKEVRGKKEESEVQEWSVPEAVVQEATVQKPSVSQSARPQDDIEKQSSTVTENDKNAE